ncbi:MAG: hypothetical protein WD424_01550 [Paenibacillaceae bacterium]
MKALLEPSNIQDNQRKLAALIRGFLRKETTQYAIKLYEGGEISSVSPIENGRCNATVNDYECREVELHIDYLPYSRCSCGTTGSCGHMGAVFLKLLEIHGLDIRQFILEYFTEGGAGIVSPKLSTVEILKGQTTVTKASTAAPAAKKVVSEPISPDHTYAEWHELFKRLLPRYVTSQPLNKQAYVKFVDNALLARLDRWPNRTMATLARIHAILYLLQVLENHYIYSYYDEYQAYMEASDELNRMLQQSIHLFIANRTREAANQGLEDASFDVYTNHVVGLADILRQYAFREPRSPVNWLFAYRTTWTSLLADRGWRNKERKLRESMANHSRMDEQLRDMHLIAAAHLDVMEERDEQVQVSLSEQLKKIYPPYFYMYLRNFELTGQWSRLELWLEWLKPHMGSMRNQAITLYLDYWKMVERETHKPNLWLSTVKSTLPGSLGYYSEYLIGQEQYEMWIDLCMTLRENPRQLHPSGFKKVQSKHAHLLLPMYHHEASLGIELRNRKSYQAAVHSMKELQLLYKKLGWFKEWKLYVERILSQYGRLRALVEEMQRGKIVG